MLATWLAFLAWASLVCGADAAMKVRYFKGQPTYISTMPASAAEVAVPPEQRKGKRVWIAVVALNFGTEPTSLGYENIDIRTTDGAAAKLITYEELRHQARVRAGWTTFFAGVAAGLNSYAAARYGGSGRIGRLSFYSPVAGQMALDRADAQNAALFTSIAANLDATLSKLDGNILRTTTIDPWTSFGGFVAFELPKGAHIEDMVVTVRFAGNTHTVPLNDAAGTLRQATALDLMGPAPPAAAPPTPVAEGMGAIAPSQPTRPAPHAFQASAPVADPPETQKCGMIQMDDGVKLVPCRPSRSALR